MAGSVEFTQRRRVLRAIANFNGNSISHVIVSLGERGKGDYSPKAVPIPETQ